MMKKLFAVSLIAIMFSTMFIGCKKGENDPALSLLSRTARITGVWKLSEANYSESYTLGTETFSFTNQTGIMSVVSVWAGVTFNENYTFSSVLNINKDNTFSLIETETNNGTTTSTTEGYWYFAPKNKDLELQNKEAVVFQITKSTIVTPNNTHVDQYTGTTNTHTDIVQLDQLSNKQIIITLNYTYTDEDGFNYSISGAKTYIQE
ncbi:MAG: hypothetical protein JXR68_11180 [Bacteroidales bacterium]|nr:hypothetical protein [Bacteroidales bacterium]